MRLEAWQMIERHLGWLDDRGVGSHAFLGVEGRKSGRLPMRLRNISGRQGS